MPKLKTHKGAASRIRLTGTGKLVRMYGSRNNFRRKKRKPVTVQFGRTVPVSPAMAKRMRVLLPGTKLTPAPLEGQE
ncbi:MAG: 50S ribosomal protein L35 [Dehalococcoidia bacterium]